MWYFKGEKKKMKTKKRTILNIIKQEYKKYQYLLNNQSEIKPEVKILLLAKRDAISYIMDKIEENEIELNNGFSQ